MKRFLFATIVFLCLSGTAIATPYYVTIEGWQSTIFHDINGYNNYISMVLLIDSSRQGTYQTADGQTHEYDDYWVGGESGSRLVDYLFADLVSFNTTLDVSQWVNEYGLFCDDIAQTEDNYAFVNKPWGSDMFSSSLSINIPGQINITMNSEGNFVWTDNLVEGMWPGWTGITMYDPSEDSFRNIRAHSLHMTSVSPVPEPATIILFSFGLAAIPISKRKFSKSRLLLLSES